MPIKHAIPKSSIVQTSRKRERESSIRPLPRKRERERSIRSSPASKRERLVIMPGVLRHVIEAAEALLIAFG
jgi:hypothetical protein